MSDITDGSRRAGLLLSGVGCVTLLALPWMAPAAAEDGPAPREPGEERVFSAAALRENPTTEGIPAAEWTAESRDPAAVLRVGPELDAAACRPPDLKLEALDASSRRAVVREGEAAPRIVRPGSRIADSAVVRFVANDKLIVEGAAGAGGGKAVFWIHLAEDGATRVQCFLAADGR